MKSLSFSSSTSVASSRKKRQPQPQIELVDSLKMKINIRVIELEGVSAVKRDNIFSNDNIENDSVPIFAILSLSSDQNKSMIRIPSLPIDSSSTTSFQYTGQKKQFNIQWPTDRSLSSAETYRHLFPLAQSSTPYETEYETEYLCMKLNLVRGSEMLDLGYAYVGIAGKEEHKEIYLKVPVKDEEQLHYTTGRNKRTLYAVPPKLVPSYSFNTKLNATVKAKEYPGQSYFPSDPSVRVYTSQDYSRIRIQISITKIAQTLIEPPKFQAQIVPPSSSSIRKSSPKPMSSSMSSRRKRHENRALNEPESPAIYEAISVASKTKSKMKEVPLDEKKVSFFSVDSFSSAAKRIIERQKKETEDYCALNDSVEYSLEDFQKLETTGEELKRVKSSNSVVSLVKSTSKKFQDILNKELKKETHHSPEDCENGMGSFDDTDTNNSTEDNDNDGSSDFSTSFDLRETMTKTTEKSKKKRNIIILYILVANVVIAIITLLAIKFRPLHAPNTSLEGQNHQEQQSETLAPSSQSIDTDTSTKAEPYIHDIQNTDLPTSLSTISPTASPTASPTHYTPTLSPTKESEYFIPGLLTVKENDLLLSRGLKSRVIAESGKRVIYKNGRMSDINFHRNPDGGAVFVPESHYNINKDIAYVYVSNSEISENKGGVGAIQFDKDGNILDYRMVLTGTNDNCSGGKTPWNTWISCEEYVGTKGQIYEVDPFGRYQSNMTVLGRGGGNFESVAVDNRNEKSPVFYITNDRGEGEIRRYRPDPALVQDSMKSGEEYKILTTPIDNIKYPDNQMDYLVLRPSSGTFYWTPNLGEGEQAAFNHFQNCEGIESHAGMLYFVSKEQDELFTLDLDKGTYKKESTVQGLFQGSPDQIVRLLGEETKNDEEEESYLFFTEEVGNREAGIYIRDSLGHYVAIVKTFSNESTGLSFSPDRRFMYFGEYEEGRLIEVSRIDGKPFNGKSMNLRHHELVREEL